MKVISVAILHLVTYAALEPFECMLETFQDCWDLGLVLADRCGFSYCVVL